VSEVALSPARGGWGKLQYWYQSSLDFGVVVLSMMRVAKENYKLVS
jgi:hypothetical protein